MFCTDIDGFQRMSLKKIFQEMVQEPNCLTGSLYFLMFPVTLFYFI